MKEYMKINIAPPYKILSWTERALPNGSLIGEIRKSMWYYKTFRKPLQIMNNLFKN